MKPLDVLALTLEDLCRMGKDAFPEVIGQVTSYCSSQFGLRPIEVAILLASADASVLSFAAPAYLVDSGMIPVSSHEAVVSEIFRKGKALVENNIQQQKHLVIFEMIPTPDKKVLPIWKMMGAVLPGTGGRHVGVIELSRRGESFQESGDDFTEEQLEHLTEMAQKVGPIIQKVMPEDYKGKVR